MARTFKDQPKHLSLVPKRKVEVLSLNYIREKIPRYAKHESFLDEDSCPICCEPTSDVNGVPYCDSCGWSTVEDLVDAMDRYEAA